MRKPFTTTIDDTIQQSFKSACAQNAVKMNDILEAFMRAYIDGEYTIHTEVKLLKKTK